MSHNRAILKIAIPIFVTFILGTISFVAHSQTPAKSQIHTPSEIIIIGTVNDVVDSTDTTNLNVNGVKCDVRGTKTTFVVKQVVKGQLTNTSISLHHYRVVNTSLANTRCQTTITESFFTHERRQTMNSGLVQFVPNPTNEFKLHLKTDGSGEFFPFGGQMNVMASVELIRPEWDFVNIYNADRMVRVRLSVTVPDGLLIEDTNGMLIIAPNKIKRRTIDATVGTNMNVGVWCDVHVYDSAFSKSTNYYHELYHILMPPFDLYLHQNLEVNLNKYYWRGKNTTALPSYLAYPLFGKNGNQDVSSPSGKVVINLTLFETDTANIDSFWNQKNARYYKVLWEGELAGNFP